MFSINFWQKNINVMFFKKKNVHLFYEIFLPYIIFLHPRLRNKCCCDSNQHRVFMSDVPRRRSHASGEIASKAIASTRFFNENNFGVVMRHYDLLRLRFALILACNFVRAYYARTHTRT